MTFAFDTEFVLTGQGRQAPPLVCIQWQRPDDPVPSLAHARDPAAYRVIRDALESEVVVGHYVHNDLAVVGERWPDLWPLIWSAYESDRVTDTAIRDRLAAIAAGDVIEGNHIDGRGWGLAGALRRWCGRTVDKSDPWRLRYSELLDIPVTSWPAEAVRYALADATATRDVYVAQPGAPDEYRQTRAAWWLHLIHCWGIRTDRDRVERYRAEMITQIAEDRATAEAAGLVRPNGTKNTKQAAVMIRDAYEAIGLPCPETPTGRPKQDEDTILATGDETLLAYQRYSSAKLRLGRVNRLLLGTTYPLQPRYDNLKETGRTSSVQGDVGVQIQNLPRKGPMRQCFVPRPGHVYAVCDWGQIELVTFAQVCIWSVGASRLADVLNARRDPHTELGARIAGITPETAAALTGEAKSTFKGRERQSAKIANFGFPGGMGAKKLALQARTQYRVEMTVQQARTLREQWLAQWPEAGRYFDWINGMIHDGVATVRQFRSDRVRGGVRYTQACNTFFQGLAADLAKSAGWRIARGCYHDRRSPLYGCRTVAFVHDEFLVEIPAWWPERAISDAALEVERIMVTEAQAWCPDLAAGVKAPAALCTDWNKEAESIWRDGILVVGDQ